MTTVNLNIDKLRSLSQIFSINNFRKIIFNNNFSYINYGIEEHLKEYNFKNYLEVITFLYEKMSNNYCNEYIYKNTLLSQKLLNKYKKTRNAVMIDELKIGNSIADFVLLNGEVQIFEIKTDLDSFTKLDKQILDYQHFADKINIVISYKNKERILELYNNSNIGILYLNKKKELKTLKKAGKNTNFSYESIFKILRKIEYLNIIKKNHGIEILSKLMSLPNTLIFKESFNLIKEIEIDKFQKLALKELKNRRIKNENHLYDKNIPFEIKHICYNLDLSEKEYVKLNNFLNTKI